MTNIVKYDYGKLERIGEVQRSIAKIKSVDQAIEVRKSTPTLVTMKMDLGFEKASSYIELLILKLNEFFNLKSSMTKPQIQETASLILEEYYYLTFTEVMFVIKEGKLGHYGELYNSIDGGKILKWFKEYSEQRFAMIEKINENERLANTFGGDKRLSEERTKADKHDRQVSGIAKDMLKKNKYGKK